MLEVRFTTFICAMISLAFILISSQARAACEETVTERVVGKGYFASPNEYDKAHQSAVNNAISKAVKPHVPPGFTSLVSARLQSTTTDDGSAEYQKKVSAAFFESARGLTKGVRILSDSVVKEAGLYFIHLDTEIEVCLVKQEEQKFEIAFGDFAFVTGEPSEKLRMVLFRSFPNISRTEKKLQHADGTYSDIAVTGVVSKLFSRPLIKPNEINSSSFGFLSSSKPKRQYDYRTVPRGMSEYNEVTTKVRVQARFVATHKIVQTSMKLTKDVLVTGERNWRKSRQKEAELLVEKAISASNRFLGKKLEKAVQDTNLY